MRPSHLDGLLGQAGLQAIASGPCAYPDEETAWLGVASCGAMQAALRAVGTARLKAAVLRAIAPYRTDAEGLRWEDHYRYVTTVPADDGR